MIDSIALRAETIKNKNLAREKADKSFLSKQKDRVKSFFAKSSSSAQADADTPDDWVPADQRWGGFDKKTIWPGVVVLILWAIWAHGLPLINSQIAYDRPVQNGDVINLGDGELTFTPAVGWNIENGALMSDENFSGVPLSKGGALLNQEGISFQVKTAFFKGTPEELLDQVLNVSEDLDEILIKDVGDKVAFKNVDGVPAVIAPYDSYGEKGAIATYVFDTSNKGSVGVEVIIHVSEDADPAYATDIVQMLATIAYSPMDKEEATR